MMISHTDVGKKGEGIRDVSTVPLGSKESHDPPKKWLRAKSLHSIMMKV
jgi:hypothetical protein